MTVPYVTPGHPVQAGAGYDCSCGECLHRRGLQAQQSAGYCSQCEEPTDEIGELPLCAYHRDMQEGALAKYLQQPTPAQCANCGKPARTDYAYSSTVCERWPLCSREEEQ